MKFQKKMKKIGYRKCCIIPMCKISSRNIRYFGLRKSDEIWYLKVVNSSNFQQFQTWQILLFFCSTEYKPFLFEILHVSRIKHCLHSKKLSDFLWNFKILFLKILNERAHWSSTSICGFRHTTPRGNRVCTWAETNNRRHVEPLDLLSRLIMECSATKVLLCSIYSNTIEGYMRKKYTSSVHLYEKF